MSDRCIPYPKLHKASGQAYLRWNGEYVYFGKYGTGKADSKYQEWKRKIETGCEVVVKGYFLTELIEDYIKANAAIHSEKIKALRDLGPLAKLDVTEYGPLAYRKHRDRMIASGTRCAGYVNSLMQLMQRVVRYGVSMGRIPISLYQTIKTVNPLKPHEVKRQSKPRKAADRQMVEQTLQQMNPLARDITRLVLFTGARPGEICCMKASEIDKKGPRGRWVYRPALHKTAHKGKQRFIVFGPEGQSIVEKWWPVAGDYFFPSKLIVGHYKTKSLLQAVHHACVRANVPIWTPYQLRHLRLTEVAVDEGLDVAAKLAGHGETGTTQGYAHQPDKKAIDDAA